MIEKSFEALGLSATFPLVETSIATAVVAGLVGIFVASKLFANYSDRIRRRWRLFQFR
jgi:hypothetical protein